MAWKSINTVTLGGRLTRDAEIRHTAGNMAVGSFSIALNRLKKAGDSYEEEAHFFDVTLFGRSAEALAPYLKRGTQVAVSGELRQDRWTNKEGKAQSRVSIVANQVDIFGGSASQGDSRRSESYQGASSSSFSSANISDEMPSVDSFEDELPF